MGKIEDKLKAAGAVVYAISNEGAGDLNKMKQAEGLGDTFVFLSDKDARVADTYAGHYEGEKTLKPATFVAGKDGKIVFAYLNENYTVRAGAQEVLDALQKASP